MRDCEYYVVGATVMDVAEVVYKLLCTVTLCVVLLHVYSKNVTGKASPCMARGRISSISDISTLKMRAPPSPQLAFMLSRSPIFAPPTPLYSFHKSSLGSPHGCQSRSLAGGRRSEDRADLTGCGDEARRRTIESWTGGLRCRCRCCCPVASSNGGF